MSITKIADYWDNLIAYKVECIDLDGELKSLIEYIAANGNGGHSFEIVVDPGSEGEKSFFWDGDGSDVITDITEI